MFNFYYQFHILKVYSVWHRYHFILSNYKMFIIFLYHVCCGQNESRIDALRKEHYKNRAVTGNLNNTICTPCALNLLNRLCTSICKINTNCYTIVHSIINRFAIHLCPMNEHYTYTICRKVKSVLYYGRPIPTSWICNTYIILVN